jgi:D-threo-aldose 1-dehydrogenase
VFNSGLLAAPDAPGATFDYAPAAAPLVDRARALARLAERHGTSLRAAALQVPARQAGVGTTLIGPSSRSELADALAGLDRPVPEGFWQDHARMEARHAP